MALGVLHALCHRNITEVGQADIAEILDYQIKGRNLKYCKMKILYICAVVVDSISCFVHKTIGTDKQILPRYLGMSHCQMLGKFEYGLPAQF